MNPAVINNDWEIIRNVASNFHDPKVVTLLESYKRDHGYNVVVTIHDNKHLKYFDLKVRSSVSPILDTSSCKYVYFRLRPGFI